MRPKQLNVLLIIEQCNPELSSVPLVGYNYYREISQLANVTLVTHERNQEALQKAHPNENIFFIRESKLIKAYYKVAERLSTIGKKIIWPLYNALIYPIYAEFDQAVYQQFEDAILDDKYDLVHAITPMMPRYPVKTVKACEKADVPFILGPVNGGVPFPDGFREVARQEFAYFNFLRLVGRQIIPGYRETYQKANYILAGSTYTLGLIKSLFEINGDRMELFYENGISGSFLKQAKSSESNSKASDIVNLLFVGRLVPYKGADMLVESISQLEPSLRDKVRLTVVGDGSERSTLEQQVQTLNLSKNIGFTGWIAQSETLAYYQRSDVFCFPSIREFGGAVVMEAMASGLPCIVVNNGGIGEYVTEGTGFKIEPTSRQAVVQQLTQCIATLAQETHLRQKMSTKAIQRATDFTWESKAKEILAIYQKVEAKTV